MLLKNFKDTYQSHQITQTKGTYTREKSPKPLVSKITNTCSSKYLMNARTHLEAKMKMPDYSATSFCKTYFPLDYRGFILFPIYVFKIHPVLQGTQRISGLAVKDWGKEGMEYLSFFLILCHYVFPYLQQRLEEEPQCKSSFHIWFSNKL